MTIYHLITFTSGDNLLGGVIVQAETFMSALDAIDHLIPEGAAVMDTKLTGPVDEGLCGRFLSPAEVEELLNERKTR